MDRDITFDHVTFGYGKASQCSKTSASPSRRGQPLLSWGNRVGQIHPDAPFKPAVMTCPGAAAPSGLGTLICGISGTAGCEKKCGMVLQEPFLFSPHH